MNEKREIEIKCEGASKAEIGELVELQGDLKELSEENYERLKNEMLELGFCEPVTIWKNNILNGHQRIKTLRKMQEEGFDIPPIPVNMVRAEDKKEAKKIVLALTSQYGSMTNQSLTNYMKESGLDLSDIEDFNFPEIDMQNLESLFHAQSGALDNIEEIENLELLGNSGIQGEVKNLTEYLIVVFPTKEEYAHVHSALGLPGIQRKIEYKDFKSKIGHLDDDKGAAPPISHEEITGTVPTGDTQDDEIEIIDA